MELELEQNHMATTFSLKVACTENNLALAEKVLLECHSEIHLIENQLSEYLPNSPVYQLNHLPANTMVKAPLHLKRILKESEFVKVKSNGSFDHLSKSSERGILEFSNESDYIFKSKNGVRLGFGAIGKGYALDHVRMIIESNGLHNYLLNAGGSSLIISGFNADFQPWKWAWSWTKENDSYFGKEFCHTSGKRVALGVSGTMEKGMHIIDPGSASISKNTISAIVANELASRADAFSTALFVKGWSDIEIYQDQNYFSAVALIDQEEKIHWNGSFQETWGAIC